MCLLVTVAAALPGRPAGSQEPAGLRPPAGAAAFPSAGTRSSGLTPPLPANGDPLYVILNDPRDYPTLLQKIAVPDLEVRRVERSPTTGTSTTPPAGDETDRDLANRAVVEAVRVRGRVRGDAAVLRVDLTVVSTADGPTWIPIRLDNQRLIDAREGTRALELRSARSGRWEVQVASRGRHRIEVDLRSTVATRLSRAGLSLDIPAAPSTTVELDFDRRQSDLIVDANETYGQIDLPDGRGVRLSAHLTPRSRIEVSWAREDEVAGENAPLLTAQGDIAIDIDTEQMRTRSSWVIRSVRGSTRTLEVRLDEDDDVTELRLGDQQAEAGIEAVPGSSRLTIPLGQPLRPGEQRRLVLKTRRSLARAAGPNGGSGRRITFVGFPIQHAREQSGAIGVTQTANLWVAPASTEGLRRILPTFLPQELRERPGTTLAFEFLDQRFTLNLDVESSPPLVRAQSRSTVRIEGDRARSESTVELQWIRGRLFEVQLAVGPGLEVVSVGPPDVVEAWNPTATTAAPGPAGAEPRGLTIRLAPSVRDQSRVTLRLEGYQRLPREGPVRLGLFAPDETSAVTSTFTIVGDRGLAVELDDDPARRSAGADAGFRVAETASDRSGSVPPGAAAGTTLVLESTGSPRSLPLRISRLSRSIRQETLLSLEVARQRIDVVQKTTFSIRHGTCATLEIRVPKTIADGWELTDRQVADREDLPADADGSKRYRLYFDRPIADRTTLTFHWRQPIHPALEASRPRELTIPRIGFPEAGSGPARVELTAASGVVLSGTNPAWSGTAGDAGEPPRGDSAGLNFTETVAGQSAPFTVRAEAMEPVVLPAIVVPRLLVRTTQGFDDALRFRAWYRVETHGPSFPFQLPDGARMISARVDGRAVQRVELERNRPGYRLWFPAEAAARPVLVDLEYQLDGRAAGGHWPAPRLLDGGVVLQTLWEAKLPWDRVLLGVPPGWSDETEWTWGGNLWTRRPSRALAELPEWIHGDGGAAAAADDDLSDSPADDSNRLLFSRSGDPADLSVHIVSRAGLVAACSGITLILGFIAMFARVRFRTAWALAGLLSLLGAALAQPSLLIQLAQSSFLGATLTGLGLLIQSRLELRRWPAPAPGTARESSSGTVTPLPEPSPEVAAGLAVGSDDPTAIRVRTPSTLDYVPSPMTGSSEIAESRSSTLGRA